jgi:transketolase
MIGVSAGLAREGYQVFASSFAPFISMRASEQIRMSLGYMQYPVKLVALGSGLVMGFLGNSHYGIEDMAVIRSIPGMSIISPADCVELIKTLQAALSYDYPLYIRLTGGVDAPIVYDNDYDFQIGKSVVLSQGEDLCIIGIGSMVSRALELARKLNERYAIKSTVVNMHTLKPLDTSSLHRLFKHFSKIITIEEHTLIGGLFSAIAEFKSLNNYAAHLIPFGIKDEYLEAGNYHFTLKEAGLDIEQLFLELKRILNLNN